MPSIIPSISLPVTAAATFAPYLRVKMSAGVLALAGASDDDIGILDNRVTATDTYGSVVNPNSPVAQLATADGVIAQYAAIYAGASGLVSAAGSKFLGYALEASAVSGDVIQIWRAPASGAVSSASSTSATSFTIGSGISTAKIKIDTASATGNFTETWAIPNLAADRTVTFPAVTSTLATLAGTETLSNKTLTTPVIGAATGTSLAVTAGLTSSGATGAGIGYATGAGGAVSQATDRTTGVTINKLAGQITTQATSLAAAALVSFTVTNSTVAIGDTVIVSIQSGPSTVGTVAYVTTVAAGSFQVTLKNLHASTADTGAAIINFSVIKSVAA